jgi:NAD(P)-dependent dehydrogenase (short-subunit alcohol dehydrogenase family)
MNQRFRESVAAAARLLLTCLLIGTVPVAAAQSTEPLDPVDGDPHTVLITGANRGIGLELARQFAAEGWQVIGTARKPGAATALREAGARIVPLDVTDAASVERMARELADTPIDLLINNAGIQPLMWTLAEIDFDAFERALAVNTVGPARVTRALLPNLRAGQLKRIVNITTNLGSIAENTEGGFYGYRESKAALNMFTKSLAAELGPDGFVCIVLHPGWVRTDLGGPQAPLEVDESVRGMRRVIDSLTAADNGTFRTWSGERMPW